MGAKSKLEGFEPYKFKAAPKVSFGYYGVTFNSGVIEGLDNPSYAQILLNRDSKKMAVKRCEPFDEQAICVKAGTENRYWRINYKDFNKTISELMGWNTKAKTYTVSGRYFEEESAYIFDLSKAKTE